MEPVVLWRAVVIRRRLSALAKNAEEGSELVFDTVSLAKEPATETTRKFGLTVDSKLRPHASPRHYTYPRGGEIRGMISRLFRR